MRIVNLTKGSVLATEARRATGFLDRSRGLLGRKNLPAGEGLLIDPCSGIHMFFMSFPIDAVFVDRDGTVLHISHEIAPWRMSRYVPRARAVLEIPAGTARSTATAIGDRLSFED